MSMLSDVLREIYHSADKNRLLNDDDYFFGKMTEQYEPYMKEDCKLIEKGMRSGAGKVILQFVNQGRQPMEEETVQFVNELVSRTGLTRVEARRLIDFLYYMVGWTDKPPFEQQYEDPGFGQPQEEQREQPPCDFSMDDSDMSSFQPGETEPDIYDESGVSSCGIPAPSCVIAERDITGREDLINIYNIFDADELTIELMYAAVANEIYAQGLPTDVETGTLKVGGFLNRSSEQVIVLRNRNHPHDYLKHVIRIKQTGTHMKEIITYAYGMSAMLAKREQLRAEGGLLNTISGARKKVEQKAADEDSYYEALAACINSAYAQIITPL